MDSTTDHRARSRRRGQVIAIVSAAAVAAVGGTFSLAAWTDTEWINTGAGDETGIGTDRFEVWQSAYTGATAGAWVHSETSPGNVVTFSELLISPNEPTYGLVALQTTADSVAGTLTLQPAENLLSPDALETEPSLFNHTEVTVWTWNEADDVPDQTCGPGIDANAVTEIATGALGTETIASTGQTLAAAGGDYQFYCFELVFDADGALAGNTSYMGLNLRPAWEFAATSTE